MTSRVIFVATIACVMFFCCTASIAEEPVSNGDDRNKALWAAVAAYTQWLEGSGFGNTEPEVKRHLLVKRAALFHEAGLNRYALNDIRYASGAIK